MTVLIDLKLTDDALNNMKAAGSNAVTVDLSPSADVFLVVHSNQPDSLMLTLHDADAERLIASGHFKVVGNRTLEVGA